MHCSNTGLFTRKRTAIQCIIAQCYEKILYTVFTIVHARIIRTCIALSYINTVPFSTYATYYEQYHIVSYDRPYTIILATCFSFINIETWKLKLEYYISLIYRYYLNSLSPSSFPTYGLLSYYKEVKVMWLVVLRGRITILGYPLLYAPYFSIRAVILRIWSKCWYYGRIEKYRYY
jgi:hypothetical protein